MTQRSTGRAIKFVVEGGERVRQQTLASQAGFERYGKKTRREQFLDEMERVVPWAELEQLVRPHYPRGANGRPPVGLSVMLRIYFLQQWFNLSDPGAEDALYESSALRRFAGVDLHPTDEDLSVGTPDLGRAPAPDETTILNFRHLLEAHDLGGEMLDAVNRYLEAKGIRIATGTIVDATIIHAPSSTKNASGERAPEMHQTKKGNQWCVSRTRAQARDAVLKMGGGLPESACRSRLNRLRKNPGMGLYLVGRLL